MENNMEKINMRTDLALETREQYEQDNVEISGVILREREAYEGAIKITTVIIENEHGERAMKKPKGSYITIEAMGLRELYEQEREQITEILKNELGNLISLKKGQKVLVVGLGNRDATPDALGPRVIKEIEIGENIYAIAPGVMAQTGMETAEYIHALVKEMCPDIIIAVDALAARNVNRLNTTIQISDTGICPGSGVGNHRKEISNRTLGIPVISIGVPTVVDAATIVNDAMDKLIDALSASAAFESLKSSMEKMDMYEKYQLIKEILEPAGGDMYVTPKDIDENVKNLSLILSDAINMALSR